MPVPANKTPEARKLPQSTPADLVRSARLGGRLSQAQVSRLSGLSIATISHVERGMRITRATAEKLAEVLAVDVEELTR